MKITVIKAFFALLLLQIAVVLAYANGPGNLDLTFAGAGYKYDGFGAGFDTARDGLIQPDGKIVLIGYTQDDISLARFNPDGSLDTTFNGDGKVTTLVTLNSERANSGALQADGKIVVGGYATGTTKDFFILRYNTNGTLDTTFDGDGMVIIPVLGNDEIFDIAVQPDGKILAVGSADNQSAVVRYNSNGTPDITFDGDGIVTTAYPSGSGSALSLAIQSDGKIVTAGGASDSNFALIRYNTNGSLDTSFDGDGHVSTSIGSLDYARSVVIQPDGKIVAAGTSDSNFALARYNTDGSLDTSFDTDGRVTTAAFIFVTDGIVAVALQSDGKIVAAGYSGNTQSNNPDFALARYNTDGSLDTSFDGDGTVTTEIGTSGEQTTSVMVQPDGKIVAAGWSRLPTDDFAMVRYNTNGSLDTSFDGDGKVKTDVGHSGVSGTDVIVQADGKIVTLAALSIFATGIARYNADGTIDASFGSGGRIAITFNGDGVAPVELLLQPDQKIVVVVRSGTQEAMRLGVMRYNADGTPDTSFDGDGTIRLTFPGDTQSYASGGALAPDGKILVTGGTRNFQTGAVRNVIVRFNTDGSPDTSFDGDGFLFSTTTQWSQIGVQTDGKIVASLAGSPFMLARYNVNGSIDKSFDGDGMVLTPILVAGASIREIFPMPDGRLLVSGSTTQDGANYDFALVRYLNDGSLDQSFNGFGKVVTPILAGDDRLAGARIQSDGKIVAAGYALTGSVGDLALVRYNTDGSLDSIYGSGGKRVIDLGVNDRIGGLALDASDKAVITGSGYRYFIARITSDFAPLVDVGGRVTSTNGQGIGNAQVVLRDQNNNRLNALTNAFGYYIFQGISSNETYTVSVSAKRYRIQPPMRTITLMNSVSDVDFIGTSGTESLGAEKPATKTSGIMEIKRSLK